MAKRSVVAREAKRERIVKKYEALRKELKEKKDYAALQALPRNSSSTRLHHRCAITGRPRAYMRKFGISRIAFRDMALQGKIPGVRKSSW
jgi:small subunit ribosomal protein S14